MTGPHAAHANHERIPASCRSCNAPLAVRPRWRSGDGDRCERCYLVEWVPPPPGSDPYVELAEALVQALDIREHETGLHSQRVACHTLVLMRRETPDPEALRQAYLGALLHDIGKIGIPDAVLLKPGPLTDEEWQVMREHPELGHRVLARVPELSAAAQVVLCHEERFDGSGYPRGLRGREIPLAARMFAVIDTLDAITSDRPYRAGASFDTARSAIMSESGRQFDPLAVDAFLAEEGALRRMVAMKCGDVHRADGLAPELADTALVDADQPSPLAGA